MTDCDIRISINLHLFLFEWLQQFKEKRKSLLLTTSPVIFSRNGNFHFNVRNLQTCLALIDPIQLFKGKPPSCWGVLDKDFKCLPALLSLSDGFWAAFVDDLQ